MNWRVPAGLLLAPLVPCALFEVAESVMTGDWIGFWLLFFAMVAVSEVIGLFVALPLFLILRLLRPIALLDCVAAGFGITVLVEFFSLAFSSRGEYSDFNGGGTMFSNHYPTGHGYLSVIVGVAGPAVLGATIGLCFWVIALRPRSHAQSGH